MAKKESKDEKLKQKVEKKEVKKTNTKKEKKNKAPKENYFAGVKAEMAKVKWPSKKEVLKYTMATIIFVLILVLFFLLMSVVMSGIKGAFN